MGNNRLVRIIIPIITAIVCIIAMVVAAFFVVHAIKDSSKDLEKEKERIEIEYQEQGEENTDPETGKTILTEKFLAKDYQKYYAGKKSSNTLMRNIILIFVLGFVAIGMLSSIADSIMAISKGRGIRVRSIITAIVVVALVIAGMYAFKKIIAMKMPPEPGQETIKVYQIKVLDKKMETETKTDSDGDKHTTTYYYLILDEAGTRRQRKVTSHIYSEAGDPGIYLLAQAEGENGVFDFELYSSEFFMKAKA
ncbi:MAG: hypothetical protein IK106_07660 [Clostridiales bacterium]|nr:hypothetical protein [Clostridiales bacterium]